MTNAFSRPFRTAILWFAIVFSGSLTFADFTPPFTTSWPENGYLLTPLPVTIPDGISEVAFTITDFRSYMIGSVNTDYSTFPWDLLWSPAPFAPQDNIFGGVDSTIETYWPDVRDLRPSNSDLPLANPQPRLIYIYMLQEGGSVMHYTLHASFPPVIVQQPKPVLALPGESATFTVVCTGQAGIQYQWEKNGIPITGANSPTYTIPTVSRNDLGNYDVVCSIPGFERVSDHVTLSTPAVFYLETNEFNLNLTVVGYSGPGTAIAIPSSFSNFPGYTVTAIGSGDWDSAPNISSISIPATVSSIDINPFGDCTNLTTISVDTSNPYFTSVNGVLFDKTMTALVAYPPGLSGAYVIPSGVTAIHGAFAASSRLTALTIPDTVLEVPEFSNFKHLTAITIGNGVTSIGSWTFLGCSSLTDITIGDHVTSIGEAAFQDCHSLTSITIPQSVTSLGLGAFSGCDHLASIIVPNSVTNIGDSAFSFCTSLTDAKLSDQLTKIAPSLFANCGNLASIAIPDTVKSIGNSAFLRCGNLSTIFFPGNAPDVSGNAFLGVHGTIYYPSGATGWTSDYGGFSGTLVGYSVVAGAAVITGGIGTADTVTVPATIRGFQIRSIANGAFAQCTNLTAITVDPLNFNYSSVDGVLFNKSLTTLIECPPGIDGSYTIAAGVGNIAPRAFTACQFLTSVTMSENLTMIGDAAFTGCISLTNITVDPLNAQYRSENGVLFDKSRTVLVAYPGGVHGRYTAPDTVTTIGANAFAESAGLTAIAIPDAVTNIAGWAFSGCTGLTNVTIGAGLSTLGEQAFANCPKLISLYFHGDAPSADPTTFTGDQATAYYLFGTSGWSSTLAGLPSVLLPYTHSNTGDAITISGYTGSSGAAIIPASIDGLPVTGIVAHAFEGSSILKTVILPDTINRIEQSAFRNCDNLTSAFFMGSAPDSDPSVFQNDLNLTIYNLSTGSILTYAILSISTSGTGGINVAVDTNWPGGTISGPINVSQAGVITIGPDLNSYQEVGVIAVGEGGTLNISSGTIINPISLRSSGTVNWSGGEIAGADVNVAGGATLNWISGSMNSPLTIASNGVVNMLVGGTIALYRPLTNWGTVNLIGPVYLDAYNDNGPDSTAAIYNQPGAVWDFQTDSRANTRMLAHGTPSFNNAGTVRKTGGAGYVQFYNFPFNNDGTVSALVGMIIFQGGGTIGGTYDAASDAAINFDTGVWGGAYSYSTVPALTGAGTFAMTGGTLTLLDDAIPGLKMTGGTIALSTNFQGGTITNLTFAGSQLSGDHIVSGIFNSGGGVSGSLELLPGATVNWSGGEIAGADVNVAGGATLNWISGSMNSPLTIASNGVVNMLVGGTIALYRPLTNWGTVNLIGPVYLDAYNDNGPDSTAAIYNQPGAVWDFQTDSRANTRMLAHGTPSFNNAGTVRKTGGAGYVQFYNFPFNNDGTVSALVGMIDFEGGLTLGGGELNFGLEGSSSSGQINVSGNINLTGTVSATLLDGFQPSVGDSFPLVTYGSANGMFTNTIFPPGIVCHTNYASSVFTLAVLGPGPSLVPTTSTSGTNETTPSFTLQFNGNRNSTYTILASTNLLSDWTVIGTASQISDSEYRFVDTPGTNSTHRFYKLRVP